MYQLAVFDITSVSPELKVLAESLLSKEEKDRYKKFRQSSDAKLFLFGRYVVKQLIASSTNQLPENVAILVDGTAEKPYVSDRSVEFSISHSGDFVAVAVSSRPIGVDIQVHDQQDFGIFDAFFRDEEKIYARQSPAHFYRLWTAVESLAKITGFGFNEALKERVPHLGDTLDYFDFQNTQYFINNLESPEATTLSIVTSELVNFTRLSPQDTVMTIYSGEGSTESAV